MKTEKYPRHPLQVRLDVRPLPRLQAALDRYHMRETGALLRSFPAISFARANNAESVALFCHLTGKWPECTKDIRAAIAERKMKT